MSYGTPDQPPLIVGKDNKPVEHDPRADICGSCGWDRYAHTRDKDYDVFVHVGKCDEFVEPSTIVLRIPKAAEPEKALTYDEGKEPLAQLPWAAIDGMSRVQAYGHKKYKDFDNYRKGMEISRNLSCAIRHIRDYINGIDKDHESGENPLSHAMCRVGFVLQNLHDNTAIDDRYSRRKK